MTTYLSTATRINALLVTFIVGTPTLSAGGQGVEPPSKFSKRGGLTGSQFLERVAWKERGELFWGGGGRGGVAVFTYVKKV